MLADEELYRNVLEELIPFNKLLNMKLMEIRDGYCKLMVPFQPALIGDPRGPNLHGGVIASAMDAVGGMAGVTTLSSYEEALSTIDMRVDYLRPGKAKDLYVEGQIARSGNRIIVTRMIAYHDDATQLIAEGKGVYNVKRKSHKKTEE